MKLNTVTTSDTADGTFAVPLTKKPNARRTEFTDARRACRNITEREQLALVLKARWTGAELSEYARLFYFRNGKDYPTSARHTGVQSLISLHTTAVWYTQVPNPLTIRTRGSRIFAKADRSPYHHAAKDCLGVGAETVPRSPAPNMRGRGTLKNFGR
jgi:hypothetical protein